MQQQQRHYVGIDLHRLRSVIVTMDDDGNVLDTVRVQNDPLEFVQAVTGRGGDLEVALESTYGWVRHEAPHDQVGGRAPPAACRSRPLKLEAA
jgi:predicted NBD/HSP70 family sugar kinase